MSLYKIFDKILFKNMNITKQKPNREQWISMILIFLTILMIVLRFLLNEKGRVSPDSIRFFRTSKVFPIIDNTTTPLGYPLSLKFFTFFGLDEFWASKVVGMLAYVFILIFCWKKKFYFKESVAIGALFSYVSIFSFSLSEPLILPFVWIFCYIAQQIIVGKKNGLQAIIQLSLILILLYNIRYSALFFMGACLIFGIIFRKSKNASIFIWGAIIGFLFVGLYKLCFIDYFNEKYVQDVLHIGLYPTSKLLVELLQALCTSFNPFIHIADPNGSSINYGIYGIGGLNILFMIYLFTKMKLKDFDKFLILVGLVGIGSSYFIQYFYSVNQLDYRLLSPFIISIWLVYFHQLFLQFGNKSFVICFISICSGVAFTWLSKGNYLQNRKHINQFLTKENLKDTPIKFYTPSEESLDNVQIAELISTVNPNLKLTFAPEDSLKKNVLTAHKVLRKTSISKNKFQ